LSRRVTTGRYETREELEESIKTLYFEGPQNMTQIARVCGVSQATVCSIINSCKKPKKKASMSENCNNQCDENCKNCELGRQLNPIVRALKESPTQRAHIIETLEDDLCYMRTTLENVDFPFSAIIMSKAISDQKKLIQMLKNFR